MLLECMFLCVEFLPAYNTDVLMTHFCLQVKRTKADELHQSAHSEVGASQESPSDQR